MKKALITGASEGIGAAIAQALVETKDYRVTLVARNEAKLRAMTATLGTSHDFIVADLSTKDGQTLITERLRTGDYDVLINNAGVGTSGDFTAVPWERQESLLRLNIEALAKLAHAWLEHAPKGGALINISSVLAFVPMPGLGIYSATKSFVTAFSDALWYENRGRDVYVAAVHPGLTETNFQVNAGGKKRRAPEGMSQTPEEVAQTVLHALKKRRGPTVISGRKNFWMASLPRILPRLWTVSMAGQAQKHDQGPTKKTEPANTEQPKKPGNPAKDRKTG